MKNVSARKVVACFLKSHCAIPSKQYCFVSYTHFQYQELFCFKVATHLNKEALSYATTSVLQLNSVLVAKKHKLVEKMNVKSDLMAKYSQG